MKKLLFLLTILILVSCTNDKKAETNDLKSLTVSGAIVLLSYDGLVVENGKTYILNNVTTDKTFPFTAGKLYKDITIKGRLTYTGKNKAITFMGNNITFQDFQATGPSASSLIEPWKSKNTIFERVILSDAKWLIRGFNDTNTTFKNCTFFTSWDDGVYFEDGRNYTFKKCLFLDANYSYWETKQGGGDGLQIAGDQGNVIIDSCIFDKTMNGAKFNLILGETTTPYDDTITITNSIFRARAWQTTAIEDTLNNHVIQGVSNVYLKPNGLTNIKNCDFDGGSNAIFTLGAPKNNFKINISNCNFTNHKETIALGSGWIFNIFHCTFRQGLLTYLKYDGTGATITKNVFIGLSNPKAGLSNSYTFTDNLINPSVIKPGYGVSNQITDTIKIYKTVITYTEKLVIKDTTIVYYKVIPIPYSIDSLMDAKMDEYFNKLRPREYELIIH